MTVLEMREKRVRLVNEARSILDNKEKLTAEDRAKYDAIMADVTALKENIDREENLAAIEGELRSTAGRQLVPPAANDEEKRLANFREYLRTGRASAEMRAVSVDNPTEGGYAVPTALSATIKTKMENQLFMLRLADVQDVPMGADSLGNPTLDTDPSDSDWTGETALVSEDSDMAFGLRELKPALLTKLVKCSLRMLAKRPDIEQLIANKLAYKSGVALEKACMTGTGNGQPLGLFTASNSGISTSRDVSTDNTATAPTLDGLKEAKYAVKAAYRANSAWIGSRAFFKLIEKIQDGTGNYIWQPSLVAGRPDTLMSHPIHESEYAPSTFTANQYVAIFGDLKYYTIARGMGYGIQRLNELYARNSQVGFIGRAEFDGMPVFEEAFARVKLGS